MSNPEKAASNQLAPEWQSYKRRVRWLLLAWVGGLLIDKLLPDLLNKIAPGTGNQAMVFIAPLWLVWFVMAAIRLGDFKCPGCDQRFFKTAWYYSPFARTCVHCGHPKWAGAPPDKIRK
jgi:hypothetical protein